MSYTQSFLPILTQDNRVLGILPIPTTVFAGTETSFTISGGVYKVALQSPTRVSAEINQGNLKAPFMAAIVTPSQERGSYQSFDFLEQQVPVSTWNHNGVKVVKNNPLVSLLKGHKVNAIVPPALGVVTTATSSATVPVTWHSAAPKGAALEVHWVDLFKASSGNTLAVNLAVGSPPSNAANQVALYVVTSHPHIINGSVSLNTIRFVKLSENPVPTGNYTWACTVNNTDGSSLPVTLTLVVS